MRIRTRLQINSWISLTIMVIMMLSFIWLHRKTSEAEQKVKLIAKLEQAAFERTVLRDEYLVQKEKHIQLQWNAKSEEFEKLLDFSEKSCADISEKELLGQIREDYDSTIFLFGKIVTEYEKWETTDTTTFLLSEENKNLFTQIFEKAYSLIGHIGTLEAAVSKEFYAVRETELMMMAILTFAALGITIANSSVVNHILAARISQLQEGTEIIALGNFEYSIAVEGDDELADLAAASNEMAARLLHSHISIENLNKEIAKRRHSEEEFRTTLYSIGDGVITTDTDGRIRQMNSVAEHLTGWREAEAKGKAISEVFHIVSEKTGDLADNPVYRVLNEGKIVGLANHTLLIAKDGYAHPIADSGAPIRDDNGSITGVVLVFRDQCKERAAQKALAESEQRYRMLVETANEGIWSMDADHVTTFVNRSMAEMLGYTSEEILGRKVEDFFFPEDMEFHRERMKVRHAGENEIYERRFRRKDGSILWTLVTANVLKDDRGNFAGSSDYVFLEINNAFEQYTGLSREIIGKKVTDIYPGIEKYDPDFIGIYGNVALSGKPVRFDVRFEPAQRWYTISAYSPKKGFFVAVFDDITERKRAEKELQRKSEELATVLDVIPALAWIASDPECQVITGNRAVNELFGISAETNVSQTAAEAGKAVRIRHLNLNGIELRAEELPMQRAIALGHPILNDEFIYDLSDGRQIYALGNAVPLFDENGNVRGAVGAFLDITERRRAEDELNRFFNLVPDMVCIASADGYFKKINAEWERVLGYATEELLAVPLADFIHPDDREETFREVTRQISGKATVNFINRYRAKDGSYHWFDWNATPAVGKKFLFASARDITERKKTEELLKTRLDLHEYAAAHTLDELLQYTLDQAERLTRSQIGFFHFLSADQKILKLQMWSSNTLKNICTAEGKGAHYPVEKAGIWADCVKQREPVIHNDYASHPNRRGMPEGHAAVIRELTFPIIRGNRILAIIGMGNKLSEYTEADIRAISELADMSWDIISGKLAEEALRISEERYRKAQILGKVGNWDYNIQTDHFWGSDEAKRIYGFDPDSELFTTEEVENCISERERVHQALVDLIEKNAEYNLEFDIITHDTKKRKTIISIAQLERDIDGRPLKITGVIQDITERKRMENVLKESEEKFYKAFHSSPAVMSISTLDEGIFLDVNLQFLKMTGLSRQEVIGHKSTDIGLKQSEQRQKILSVLKTEGFVHNLEVDVTTKSGKIIPLLWFGDIIHIRNKPCLIVTAYDITERKKAEEKIKASLKEKEVLLREIHHRVKNNLMVVNSLIQMQSEEIGDPNTAALFRDLNNRVMAMAMVHEDLYRSESLSDIDFAEYLERLIDNIRYGFSRSSVNVKIDAFGMFLDIDKAIPCGLIIAELVTNAFKYAFPEISDIENPEIRVELRKEGNAYTLTVSDNGVGIPADIDWHSPRTLGLELVRAWADHQLKGTIDMDIRHGTKFIITFKDISDMNVIRQR